MEAIYADLTVSLSEFKKNPAKVLRAAKGKPVAVLNHNKPAFYMITPHIYEMLIEEFADRDLCELVRIRLAQNELSVEVDIDAI